MLRNSILHILVAALLTGQAMAQQPAQKPATRSTTPDTKAESAQLPTVVALDTESCRKLVARQPRAVPGADYVPGVDVHGRPVTPADLPPSQNGSGILDPRFGITLKFTLAELLGSRAPALARQAEVSVGKLELDPASGKLNFQNQPVEKPAEDAVLTACRDHLSKLPPKR
ncbi:hypothetical protein [Ferrovibrio sp.]|uniref:hypothetical protein n=1 Tax=Ferrovibrio sp. TaxID=1917215 RepID=UPI003D12D0B9